MNQIMVIKNSTLVRLKVITKRTGDTTLAMVKAMMIDDLKQKLRTGVAHFLFIKRNGEVREAFGTTSQFLVEKHVSGLGVSRESFATTAYFDIEKGS